MFGLGFSELLVIFVIALIFIGPKKLPELAKGLGKGIKQFQDAAKGLSDQLQDENHSNPSSAPRIADATQKEENDKDKPQT